jgi:hypothetical protein
VSFSHVCLSNFFDTRVGFCVSNRYAIYYCVCKWRVKIAVNFLFEKHHHQRFIQFTMVNFLFDNVLFFIYHDINIILITVISCRRINSKRLKYFSNSFWSRFFFSKWMTTLSNKNNSHIFLFGFFFYKKYPNLKQLLCQKCSVYLAFYKACLL